ncbi:MAG: M3 family metallopeptidase, partial [Burkholderiaceae bacterium]
FLSSVQTAAAQVQATEFAAMRAEKAKLNDTLLADTQLKRWDVAFYKERVRQQRYKIDQEALRAYFPTEQSVQYVMKLAETLYGIEFVARKVPTWSPDVRYHDVYDRRADGKRGAFLGGIYLDLFPREGKYNHAAAFPVAGVSTLAGRTPISVMVANLDPKGLNHEELETLLHEYGHVLHGVLSKTRYVDHSGTSVKRDFVEAPSQMFEEWARREEPLALLAQICPTCPKLSREQIAQLNAARNFGLGNLFARQSEYALYDMQLNTGKPQAPMPVWIAIESKSPLGYVEGSLFPAGFGHLLGGYAAGYYGYMWSQVLALDMLAAFDGKLMNPAVGRRYRDTILASGGQRKPQEMVESFLGRKSTSDAFFAEISGKR